MCCLISVWQDSLINSLATADEVILVTSGTKATRRALQHVLHSPARGHELPPALKGESRGDCTEHRVTARTIHPGPQG